METILKLRDYQKEAVEAGCKYLMHEYLRPGIMVAPTGCGKSLIISCIASGLNASVLVLQPSKEILLQNSSAWLIFYNFCRPKDT